MSDQSTDVTAWVGRTLVDQSGDKIGTIDDVYLDDASGQPEWLAVSTGLLGRNLSFVPIEGASPSGDDLMVPYAKSQVKDAPNAAPDGHLSPEEEQRLYEHYGRSFGDWSYDDTTAGTADYGTTGTTGYDTSGPTTDEAMTRSEEELAVGTQRQETGRARLRKYVVTENVTTTVPVQREVARLEREPITDANVGQAMDGPAISEEEHEVVLTEEQPVVEKRVVPKERVRLDTETVTEQRQVNEDVRKEVIEPEGGVDLRDADANRGI
jgi:uncharacterized protein (TIGR02271 family)